MSASRSSHPAFALVLLAVASAGVGGSAAQVVSLENTAYDVVEGITQATITVLISQPPALYGGCLVSFEDVDAESGVDYVPLGGWVDWVSGDGSPKQVVVEIPDDSEIETTETFTATISYVKQLEIGSPSQATISIVDDDGAGGDPYAYVDMTGATPNANGEWVVFAQAESMFEVTVRYTEVPESPVAVNWESDASPFSGTVVFDGTDRQTVMLDLVGPNEDSPMTLSEFRLVELRGRSPRDELARGINFFAFNFFVAQGSLSKGTQCWGCIFYLFSNLASFSTCPFDCTLIGFCDPGPSEAPRRRSGSGGWLSNTASRIGEAVFPTRTEVMRRYREEVLLTTQTGEYYASEFEAFSVDAITATLRRPKLFFRIMDAVEAWIPALEDLLDGTGTSVIVSQTMIDQLNVVLDAFEDVGEPSFATKIATERDKLQIDGMVGLSAAQVQDRIETLGQVPTRTVSWGTLKQRFR